MTNTRAACSRPAPTPPCRSPSWPSSTASSRPRSMPSARPPPFSLSSPSCSSPCPSGPSADRPASRNPQAHRRRDMLIRRRPLLAAAGASTLAAPALIRPAHAQAKQINLAGASYDMREAILGEFGKRTGITPRPFVNPSTQVRVDRLRTAPVDCVLLDAPFAAYANSEKLLQPIDLSPLAN